MKAKREPLAVEVVRKLLAAGLTDQQIAVATGHVRNNVKACRRRFGLPCNPEERPAKLNVQAVRTLVGEGWSGPRIAAAFGVQRTSVYDCMEKHGIKPASRAGRKRKGGK